MVTENSSVDRFGASSVRGTTVAVNGLSGGTSAQVCREEVDDARTRVPGGLLVRAVPHDRFGQPDHERDRVAGADVVVEEPVPGARVLFDVVRHTRCRT